MGIVALLILAVLAGLLGHYCETRPITPVHSGILAVVGLVSSGLADEKNLTLEVLTSIKRAGADIIITYHALEAARWLRE